MVMFCSGYNFMLLFVVFCVYSIECEGESETRGEVKCKVQDRHLTGYTRDIHDRETGGFHFGTPRQEVVS
jgi:hypothetical protein